MVEKTHITTSKAIQRRTGKTFHLATRLLPTRVRHATYVLYAFFRVADDVVDTTADRDPGVQREELEGIRAAALGARDPESVAADTEVLAAFRELATRHGISDEDIHTFIDAMQADLEKTRYESHAELEEYMRGSAVAVGYMMMDVMEVAEPETAAPHAAALAEAFQLSNFLRDVAEDVHEYDRVYLPAESRADHGVTVEQLRARTVDAGFREAMREELAYTERKYRTGVAGIEYLPEDCQFAVLVSAVLYADHHRAIRERDCDVLTATPSLSTPRKLWLVAKTRALWALNSSPEAVFYRATGLAETGDSRRRHGDPQPTPSR
ncbi:MULTISPECIES: phytoene/squalene synthase family protein [Halobacterium]|uniref:Phytoene synthase n=4 Tax=Halobacterium salinarum TaxID=2242 RepID=Q9HPE1_HALSA|nr:MULTISPECIES: phytoene/squalene synthase family protein [Halobacterium]AAG19929.1 phytoene synthase [Halobacterium salinarum NRC-1]MBB6088935.1 phytoene synthase [Halobacterium salinarum]MCF2164848.1 phytoene/squalene synthase family protein [Halobacterium salinarum]MCF2168527.1 phytoene/squalene synthase family protein [Halobacterium salinarum]MCF2207425.1 phytoene/squalene synthase family protein [Halobacterium salinarum]